MTFSKFKIIFAIILLFPINAHAYLDPGTGNALIAAIFGLIGSIAFFSKNIFYKVKSMISGKKEFAVKYQLAIFSEGARYWIYFKDIVSQLIERKISFIYYTMDINDPALDLFDSIATNPNSFDSYKIRYVGQGNKGYAAISNLKEPCLLSTTPHIGVKKYPIKKPPNCKNLIHLFHSVAGIANYQKHSLDFYDSVILSGSAFEKDIRLLEKKRNLAPKKLLVGGLPYIDDLVERASKIKQETNGKTILVASTWNKRGCLQTYGAPFIISMAKAGYDIIVRPHPYSYTFEPDFIEKLKNDLKSYPNIVFDDEIDNLKSLAKADILVSDVSSIRLDYFFAFKRPSISLETIDEINGEYEYDDLDSFWSKDISNSIGVYVSKDDIGKIVDKIKEASSMPLIDKESIVANIGSSTSIITEQIISLMNTGEK
ncbi:MAG: CDP-glycerol glycerophosphotransferase family protein [Elusimicrobiota bacterium]|nr:CDP-glycerol glycerophosphotransferase family protein [Elusimicrobiota bacterium]